MKDRDRERQERALTVRLAPTDYAQLVQAADELGLSVSAVSRLALRRALKEHFLEHVAGRPEILA